MKNRIYYKQKHEVQTCKGGMAQWEMCKDKAVMHKNIKKMYCLQDKQKVLFNRMYKIEIGNNYDRKRYYRSIMNTSGSSSKTWKIYNT